MSAPGLASAPGGIAKLHDEIVKVLKMPAVTEQLNAQGAEAVGDSPQQVEAYIKAEIARWMKVIAQANIRPD